MSMCVREGEGERENERGGSEFLLSSLAGVLLLSCAPVSSLYVIKLFLFVSMQATT